MFEKKSNTFNTFLIIFGISNLNLHDEYLKSKSYETPAFNFNYFSLRIT